MRSTLIDAPTQSPSPSIQAARRSGSTSISTKTSLAFIRIERRLRNSDEPSTTAGAADRTGCAAAVDNRQGHIPMSLVRLLPAWRHAIADYAVGLGLIIIAVAVGGSGKAVAAGVVVGATVLVVSMLTRYPLGVAKVLPFTVHSAGD